MVIDFTKEATELGAQPKQDYKLNIDLGEQTPPKTEADGKPYDEAAKDIVAEESAKKDGGAYRNAAKMIIQVENAVSPRIAGMMLKQDHRQFTLDDESEEMLVELLAPVLEFHQFKPKDPTLAFIVVFVIVRFVPIWDARQKVKKQDKHAKAATQENQAKGRSTKDGDSDVPVSPAEEVDDAGNVIKPAPKYFHKDGTPAVGDVRICKHKNCNNALQKSQTKFCSRSCQMYQQALDKVIDE